MPSGPATNLIIHEHPSHPGEIDSHIRNSTNNLVGSGHVIASDHPDLEELIGNAKLLGSSVSIYLSQRANPNVNFRRILAGVDTIIDPDHPTRQVPKSITLPLEQMPSPIIVADSDNRIGWMNDEAKKYFADIKPGHGLTDLCLSSALYGISENEAKELGQTLQSSLTDQSTSTFHFQHGSGNLIKVWKSEQPDGRSWRMVSMVNDLAPQQSSSIQDFVRQYARFFYDKVFLLDSMRLITWCSQSARDSFFITPEKHAITLDSLVHPEDLQNIKLGEMFESMINRRFELRMRNPDGSYRWYEVVSHSFQESDGRSGMVVLLRNIHQRKTAEWALFQSERKFKGLFNNVMHAISIFQNDKLVLANQKFFDTLGKSTPGNFTMNDLLPSIDPADRGRLLRLIANFRQSDQEHMQDIPLKIIKPGGSHLFTTNTIAKIDFEGSKALLIVTSDDTDKVQVRRQTMLQRIEAQDSERKRLAHDLHDGLGQTLSALGMYLNALKNNHFKEGDQREGLEEINEMEKLIQQAIGETRSISYNLMPNTLKQFGLVEALEESVKRINYLESGLMINFKHAMQSKRLPEDVELSVYRIIQEIITNTVKHSQASVLILEVLERNGTLVLTSVDNGKGFDLEDRMSKGIGLGSIQDRLDVLHASLEIESKIGFGTSYRIIVPIASRPN